jgi:hypothetical protein
VIGRPTVAPHCAGDITSDVVSEPQGSYRANVVSALRLVVLTADEQVAALPEFVHVPDEVALIYDDAYRLVPPLTAGEFLTPEQAAALDRLDRHFASMTESSNKALWTIAAMATGEQWATSRALARDALASLGESPGAPDFEGTRWIQGRRE